MTMLYGMLYGNSFFSVFEDFSQENEQKNNNNIEFIRTETT